MVANIRCEEIAADQLAALLEDQAWAALKAEAATGVVSDFGVRASALLHSCLTGGRMPKSLRSLAPVNLLLATTYCDRDVKRVHCPTQKDTQRPWQTTSLLNNNPTPFRL